jgi:hypothetical protein
MATLNAGSRTSLYWYLIHCKPREDERALENLERQTFECYCPVRLLERCRDGRKYSATEPLFRVTCSSGWIRTMPTGIRFVPHAAYVE